MTPDRSGMKISVRGIVQGVGFRPFIFNLASSLSLSGWVKNTSAGVEIELNGAQAALLRFLEELRTNPPPLSRIDALEARQCPPSDYAQFEILASQVMPGDFMPVPPEIAVCPDCRRELFDPADRRYRYPFINCTNCGPRFSIIRDLPYDRPNTSMSAFPLCPDCTAEYQNPADRRFHAQPVACPACGPSLRFEVKGERLAEKEAALQTARAWLRDGKILAVKGLGGFHLACDAANSQAVAELRRRKKRSDKPFALMAFSLDIVRRHCAVTDVEAGLLQSRQAPIVLLEKLPASPVSAECAPQQNTLGVMLAYTPLHLLLCEPSSDFPEMLVMTSGNLSEEPIAFRDEDALDRLAPLADGFLLHDRPIHIRVDDSVLAEARSAPYFVRRARGYAPDPVRLPLPLPPLLASGAELKNTFCLTRDRYAFLSHHIGDLENYETLQSFEEGIDHYERLFHVQPQALACDLHPNYLATRYAEERARRAGLPLFHIQHHHAHLAACLAENGWDSDDPVIGVSFDGTGLGTDGAIWGGEILVGGYQGYERRFHLSYAPLPGGDAAVRRPSRMALSHLWQAGIEWDSDLMPAEDLCADERTVLHSQLEHAINSPLTSSMGRLFDAVSALIGLRTRVNYEGQAAIELEAAADRSEIGCYPFEIARDVFNPAPVLNAILRDWRAGVSIPVIAARFHNSVAALVVDLCAQIRTESAIETVALSGGVWQNRLLLDRACDRLEKAGFKVFTHHQVPPNDGCIALGQALIASAALSKV